jgi:MFS family permease
MRTFIILWLGQIVSSIGSSMTYFALMLWVWQQTQSATAIALILVFYQLPQVAMTLVSGLLVDRISRKHLLMFSDTASACCTLSVGILATTQTLQIWHIYCIAAIIGCFGNIQALTYSTMIPLLVPKDYHSRASSMAAMVGYAAGILAPAFAGLLYPRVGLWGITLIDMGTFAIATLSLLMLSIPQTQQTDSPQEAKQGKQIWQDATFGFRYIAAQPSLLVIVIAMSWFAFLNQIGEALYQPMILARTEGNAQILGTVVAASGLGGVIGAIALSLWSGFRRRISGLLFGFIGTGLSRLVLGLGQVPLVWAIAQFGTSLHSPLIFSSYMAVWYAKVAPDLQGRVFAADYLIGIVIESLGGLSAGVLADQVFEPAMRSGGWLALHLGAIAGTGSGSGMVLLYTLTAITLVLCGIGGFAIHHLRDAEDRIADWSDYQP